MCPVQWRPPSRKPSGLSFLRIPPARIVTMIDAPHEYAIIALHWQESSGQSFPCMGPGECKLCPSAVKVHVYTVLRFYDAGTRTWVNAIADLGHPETELATKDFRGVAIQIGRERPSDKRSNVKFLGQAKGPAIEMPTQEQRIDVRPHLMRRWGLFDEADALTREPYYEQERLAFPLPTGESESA